LQESQYPKRRALNVIKITSQAIREKMIKNGKAVETKSRGYEAAWLERVGPW
jgi:hypothetical protein